MSPVVEWKVDPFFSPTNRFWVDGNYLDGNSGSKRNQVRYPARYTNCRLIHAPSHLNFPAVCSLSFQGASAGHWRLLWTEGRLRHLLLCIHWPFLWFQWIRRSSSPDSYMVCKGIWRNKHAVVNTHTAFEMPSRVARSLIQIWTYSVLPSRVFVVASIRWVKAYHSLQCNNTNINCFLLHVGPFASVMMN